MDANSLLIMWGVVLLYFWFIQEDWRDKPNKDEEHDSSTTNED
jgi:hypothetical protein